MVSTRGELSCQPSFDALAGSAPCDSLAGAVGFVCGFVPGVVSGQFDFGFSNMTSLLVAQSKNVPVKAVVNGVASTGKVGADFAEITVKKGSPLKSASDLEGKKVAANTLGNICDTSVNESVRKDGGEIEVEELDSLDIDAVREPVQPEYAQPD